VLVTLNEAARQPGQRRARGSCIGKLGGGALASSLRVLVTNISAPDERGTFADVQFWLGLIVGSVVATREGL